jgi:hypothetical protein
LLRRDLTRTVPRPSPILLMLVAEAGDSCSAISPNGVRERPLRHRTRSQSMID